MFMKPYTDAIDYSINCPRPRDAGIGGYLMSHRFITGYSGDCALACLHLGQLNKDEAFSVPHISLGYIEQSQTLSCRMQYGPYSNPSGQTRVTME